jgi:hypothetical protein
MKNWMRTFWNFLQKEWFLLVAVAAIALIILLSEVL